MVKIDTLKNVVNTADEYSKIIWREYETLKKTPFNPNGEM
jgi:hypothetical protein